MTSATKGSQTLEELRGPPRWRDALALVLVLPAPTLGVMTALVWWPGAGGQAVYFAAKVWLLVLPAFWHLVVDRQPLSWSSPRRGGFDIAIALGLAIFAVVVGGYWLFARQLVDPELMRPVLERNNLTEPWRYLLLAAYLTTFNSLAEEYVWRWFVFRKFERVLGGWHYAGAAAVVLAAAGFTVHHAFALSTYFGWLVTALCSLGVFIGGAVWSWLYLRYRSVWPCYVSHAIVDVAVFLAGWWLIFA